jgi:toxin ParE1/3/4
MLREIHDYYADVAGEKVAKRLLQTIFDASSQIIVHPKSGPEEPMLIHLDLGHRYLVRGNFKIIYREVSEGVLITDVFDTQQQPEKMNNPKRMRAK